MQVSRPIARKQFDVDVMNARAFVMGLAAAAFILPGIAPVSAQQTPLSVLRAKSVGRCVTIEEAFVGFGEETTRGDAFHKLDQSVAILRVRRPRYAEAKEKSRDATCESYLKALNEYECHARATLCR